MTEHEFNSAVGKTMRQIGELFLLLASQFEVDRDHQADVTQEALWRVEERHRARIDRLNEQVGDTNLMVGTLAEHEAQTDADLSKRVGDLEGQTRAAGE
jgi:hypothetical protein